MNRIASCCGLIVLLFGAACAGRGGPRTANGGEAASGDTCSSVAQPGVDADTVERMATASNVIEYENIWRNAHPGEVAGTVSGNEVRALIRSRAAEIRGCYESALDSLPEGGGQVIVRFMVEPSGDVPVVHISSNELQAPEVGCCVAKHVAEWRFPATTGGFVVVEYPFVVRVSRGK